MTRRRRTTALLAAGALGLLGVTGCSNGSDLEPTTEEPGFSSQLPDADEVDEDVDEDG